MKGTLPNYLILATALFGVINFSNSAPAPELPGEEITEAEESLEKSDKLVTEVSTPVKKSKYNWHAPDIDEQLARDKTLIGMGYGALFVPTYSESRLEPEVIVYKGDDKLTPGFPGERILLEEGSYLIRTGSGSLNQKMKYFVTINEGKTTVVRPEWSGLIVEVLNQNGDYINKQYDLFAMGSSESYGRGYGLEEERIKDINTWILPSGMYKITKVGESFASLTNYITVQLNPSELTVVEIVYDENEENLIAGGIKELKARRKVGDYWKYGVRFGGNVSLNSRIVNYKEESNTVSTLIDLKIRAKYDNKKYLGINEIRTKNIFQWEKDEDPSSVTDDWRLRSSWVRRLNKYVGPYVSAKVESQIFPQEEPIAESDTLLIQNEKGTITHYITNDPDSGSLGRYNYITEDRNGNSDTLRIPGKNFTKFETSPSFYPILAGVGAGVNLEILTFYWLELSTQVGVGVRQTIRNRQLAQIDEVQRIWGPIDSEFKIGLENTLNNRFRLGNRLTFDLQTEMFFENGLPSEFLIEEFSADTRFNLTKNIELSYLFEIEDRLDRFNKNSPLRYEYLQGVLLRISINI